MRDGDKSKWLGKGVQNAVRHINETIAQALIAKGLDVTDQRGIDAFLLELDGTENKCA